MLRILVITLFLCLASGETLAMPAESSPKVRGRLQYYFDSRDFNTLNSTIIITDLPLNFSIFGFTNFNGREGDSSERFDIRQTVSEYRLSNWLLGEYLDVPGLGLLAEVNYRSPGRTALGRFGVSYKRVFEPPWYEGGGKGFASIRATPFETGGDDQQFGMNYNFPLFWRFFINGFSEYTVRHKRKNAWLNESQLNLKITGPLSAVLEFRHNGFLSGVPGRDTVGWAPGLRVDFMLP